MRKKILPFIAVLCIVISLGTAAFSENTAVSETRNGVAYMEDLVFVEGEIFTGTKESYGPACTATCFFVGRYGENPQYLITNYHVIDSYMSAGAGKVVTMKEHHGKNQQVHAELWVYFDEQDRTQAYVVDFDQNQDIALLRLSKPTDKKTALCLRTPTQDMVGDSIYIIGYPGIANEYIYAESTITTSDSLVSSAIIGRLLTDSTDGSKWIQYSDTQTSQGNSGGPLIYTDGSVVGVVSSRMQDENGNMIQHAVNIEAVESMLKSNGVPYSTYEALESARAKKEVEKEKTETAENTPEPVEETAVPTDGGESDPGEDGQDGADSNKEKIIQYAIIIGAAVLVLLVIILIIRSVKKKKRDIEKLMNKIDRIAEKEPEKPEKIMRAYVRSKSNQHGGEKVRIGEKPLTVGRAEDNKLVFHVKTPGVSAHHCTIDFDPKSGDFIITDLKSSVGTFLEDGTRIPECVPYNIKSGDSIYLGYKENMLRMEVEQE